MKLVLGVLLAATAPAVAQEGATVKRELRAVRLQPAPVVDGDLSDACWQEAARAEGFTDVLYGSPVGDQTVAYLGYDDRHIYVAFHAYDSQPAAIVARERKRGSPLRDEDVVTFTIDPFHTHQGNDHSIFRVNPLGTQSARLAGERATKLEWEGAWRAAARIVTDGWTAEMAIPWEILNYPTVKGPATCGVNFARSHQRTHTLSFWSNIGPNEFQELDGHWVGVEFPPFRPRLSLLPYVTPGWRDEGGTAAQRGSGFRAGLDVRHAPTPSLTLVGTVNPDFGNVEGAVEGIDFSYGERFVPDRRPFFLEGASIYRNSGEAWRHYYSPRIRDFDLGVNLYGKVSPRETLGVLAAWDVGRRLDSVLRASHAFGASSSAGVMLVSRDDRQESNRVLVGRGGVRRGFWSVSGAWAGSWAGEGHLGTTGEAHFAYQTPRWYAEVAPHFITPRFRDDLGLVPFTGFRGVNSYLDYGTEWRRGPLRSLFVTSGIFDSDRYDGAVFRRERRLIAGVTTRGDHSLRVGWEGGRYEAFRDSVFGVDWRARVSDPFHNFGLGVSWGRRAGALILFVTPGITWRFGEALTLGLSSAILRHASDAEQHILTANYDFSPERGIVGRLVAQTGGTNAYVAYRRSGYGGVETFLILGDPNTPRFRKRVALKVVWAQ